MKDEKPEITIRQWATYLDTGMWEICGEAGKRGMHRIAPVICPIAVAQWKDPKLVLKFRWEDAGRQTAEAKSETR